MRRPRLFRKRLECPSRRTRKEQPRYNFPIRVAPRQFTAGRAGGYVWDVTAVWPGRLFRFHCLALYDVPFAAALGAAAMFSDLLFLISQQHRVEYPGDGVGEKVNNVSPAARGAKIMRAYAAGAKTGLAAVVTTQAASAADDATISPVSARFWIGWHIRLPVISIGQ